MRSPRAILTTSALALTGATGCCVVPDPPPRRDFAVVRSALHESQAPPLAPALELALPAAPTFDPNLAAHLARALANNRLIHAARSDVLAFRARVPQVKALEDPMVANGMWPFPSNAPQYSLMGYMPYELMISQAFPWFGTLHLRGCVAEQEARAALWRLAETQLAVATDLKRAYYAAQAAERSASLLAENLELAEQIVELTRTGLAAGASQQDVLRAEVAAAEIERQLALVDRDRAVARAELARLLHADPNEPLAINDQSSTEALPLTFDQLAQLAIAARPDLQADLAEIARAKHEIALARKRFYPDFSLGIGYNTMTPVNNPSPQADGRDNVGFLLSFNLPIYRNKLHAGVHEAQAKAIATAQRYEAGIDEALRATRAAFAEVHAQQRTVELLRDRIAPKSQLALQSAIAGYQAGTLDFVTLNSARQELLDIELEVIRADTQLAQALADLEKTVGTQLQSVPFQPQTISPPPPATINDDPSPLQP